MAKQHKAAGASAPMRDLTEDEIRSIAYGLYCEGGYQDGRDIQYWLEAEQRVLARGKAQLRRVA